MNTVLSKRRCTRSQRSPLESGCLAEAIAHALRPVQAVLLVALVGTASMAQSQVLEQELTAPSGEIGNELGISVAVDTDRFVAGAPQTVLAGYAIPSSVSPSGVVNTPNIIQNVRGSGAVGVYLYGPGGWQLEQYIDAPYGGPPDEQEGLRSFTYFGTSIAISDSRMLIGAPGKYFARFDPSTNVTQAGNFYVQSWQVGEVLAYELEAGNWELKQTIAPPGNFIPRNPNFPSSYRGYSTQQFFGQQVAIGGDYAAIGAPGNLTRSFPTENFPVRIYWYGTRAPSVITCASKKGFVPNQAFPTIPVPDTYALPYIPPLSSDNACWYAVIAASDGIDRGVLEPPVSRVGFGSSLAMSADGSLLAVGAPYESNGSIDSAGAVYLYERVVVSPFNPILNGFELKQKLVPLDPGPGDLFGVSVAIEGRRIAVGATLKDCTPVETTVVPIGRICEADPLTGNLAAGAVYVFEEGAGSIFAEDAKISNGGGPLYLGASLALRGDDLFAGAPGFSAEGFYQGAVFHYRKEGGTWNAVARLDTPLGLNQEGYGLSLAADGVTLVVGDPTRTTVYTSTGLVLGTNTGRAFVYELPPGSGTGAGAQPLLPTPEPGAGVGVVAAIASLAALARSRRA